MRQSLRYVVFASSRSGQKSIPLDMLITTIVSPKFNITQNGTSDRAWVYQAIDNCEADEDEESHIKTKTFAVRCQTPEGMFHITSRIPRQCYRFQRLIFFNLQRPRSSERPTRTRRRTTMTSQRLPRKKTRRRARNKETRWKFSRAWK